MTTSNNKNIDVERAEQAVLANQSRCDSIRRKLDAGSKAVTAEDFDQAYLQLTQSRLTLGEVSPGHLQALLHTLS